MRNYIFLGRLADKEGKSLCVQLFAKVGGVGGFCACLNGNAVAHLCVLGYGIDADKTDAVFNALGLACSRIEPLGGIISAAGFAAGKLGSNTGNYNLISVMELIGTYIGIVSAISHSSGVNINAIDKQCIKGAANQAHVVLGHSLFYLRCAGSKCIKGSSADIDRIPNGGFAGFKGHCGVVITVGACGFYFVAEVHIFNVLKAYGYVDCAYKLAEFLRKSLHVRFKILKHIPFTGCAAFFVEHKVNIGFKVVPRTDKRLPGIGGIVAFGIFCGVIKLKKLFCLVLVFLVILKCGFIAFFPNKVFICFRPRVINSVNFRLLFFGICLVCYCAVRIKGNCRCLRLNSRQHSQGGIC